VKLNRDQKRIFAEIIGNLAVAWFVVGIISPSFGKEIDVKTFVYSFLFGLIMFFGFSFFAIYILKK